VKRCCALFGITGQERTVRVDDFHVPAEEVSTPPTRELTIDSSPRPTETTRRRWIFGQQGQAGSRTPIRPTPRGSDFFQRMAATEGGKLKVRIVLQARCPLRRLPC
jgi:hypothetical protein